MLSRSPEVSRKHIFPWVFADGAFTSEELQSIIDYCELQPLEIGPTVGKSVARVSDVRFIRPADDNQWIFNKIDAVINYFNASFYHLDLNGYESFQYTTYNAENEGRYDWHLDVGLGEYSMDEPRKLSLSILLNDDFEGGLFQQNQGDQDKPATIDTPKGRIIAFPSFMIHRVTPISKGIRRSLVIWVVGPKWK